MPRIAYVFPADLSEPGRTFTWRHDGELLALLYGEIGCDTVACTPEFQTPFGRVVMWCDDVALVREGGPLARNERAMALADASGGYGATLAGTVVVTGGAYGDGETAGLNTELLDAIARMGRFLAQGVRPA